MPFNRVGDVLATGYREVLASPEVRQRSREPLPLALVEHIWRIAELLAKYQAELPPELAEELGHNFEKDLAYLEHEKHVLEAVELRGMCKVLIAIAGSGSLLTRQYGEFAEVIALATERGERGFAPAGGELSPSQRRAQLEMRDLLTHFKH